MKVAVIHDYLGIAEGLADWDKVSARAEVSFFAQPFVGDDEVVTALEDFDVICAMRERLPLTSALMERLPNLRFFVATGEVNRAIDFDAAKNRGIEIAGTPSGGLSRAATAELTWGLIIAAFRGMLAEDRAVRAGKWQGSVYPTLYGKTIGIIGFGGTGRYIARFAQAFGMRVLVWSRNLDDMAAVEAGGTRVDLDELLRSSDVVSLHMVLSDSTRHLIDERALSLMKPTAVLVNTSRGPLIDETALIKALRDRRIKAAALDAFEVEPLAPDHPFRSMDNMVLSPHTAGFTEETYRVWYEGTVDAVTAFLDGRDIPVRHVRQ